MGQIGRAYQFGLGRAVQADIHGPSRPSYDCVIIGVSQVRE